MVTQANNNNNQKKINRHKFKELYLAQMSALKLGRNIQKFKICMY